MGTNKFNPEQMSNQNYSSMSQPSSSLHKSSKKGKNDVSDYEDPHFNSDLNDRSNLYAGSQNKDVPPDQKVDSNTGSIRMSPNILRSSNEHRDAEEVDPNNRASNLSGVPLAIDNINGNDNSNFSISLVMDIENSTSGIAAGPENRAHSSTIFSDHDDGQIFKKNTLDQLEAKPSKYPQMKPLNLNFLKQEQTSSPQNIGVVPGQAGYNQNKFLQKQLTQL